MVQVPTFAVESTWLDLLEIVQQVAQSANLLLGTFCESEFTATCFLCEQEQFGESTCTKAMLRQECAVILSQKNPLIRERSGDQTSHFRSAQPAHCHHPCSLCVVGGPRLAGERTPLEDASPRGVKVLRPAVTVDLDDIRRWRNHPKVRSASINQHVISEAEHLQWWRRAEDNPRLQVLVFERFGKPSGVMTFNVSDDSRAASWGFYVDNDGLSSRGELLPALVEIVAEGVKFARDGLGLDRINAETLSTNVAGWNLHRLMGFSMVETQERDRDEVTCKVIKSTLNLRES